MENLLPPLQMIWTVSLPRIISLITSLFLPDKIISAAICVLSTKISPEVFIKILMLLCPHPTITPIPLSDPVQ